MKKLVVLGIVGFALTSGPALAHGGKSHIMGTVTAVSSTGFDVKAQDGEVTTVRSNSATKYQDQDGKSSDIRPEVGSRVVVDLEGSGHDQAAGQVRIAAPKMQGHGNGEHGDHAHADKNHGDKDHRDKADGDKADGDDEGESHHGDHAH